MTVLEEQLEYYRARAAEYDQWFFRQGRFDRGPELNQCWRDEIEIVRDSLRRLRPMGDALDIACGTGIWTEQLAQHARSVVALDGAPEMLKMNWRRNGDQNIEYLEANIFDWTPHRQFDVVFFGFWLSHVPDDKFASFWNTVRLALKPNGRVFFVDSLPNPDSRAKDNAIADESTTRQKRILNDGREFEIIKRYYQQDKLSELLRSLGWKAAIDTTESFFLYGTVLPQ